MKDSLTNRAAASIKAENGCQSFARLVYRVAQRTSTR